MSAAVQKIALVTGANKGLGFEIARRLAHEGCFAWLGCRDEARGRAAEAQLKARGLDVEFVHLEMTDPATIEAVARAIEDRHGRLDVLVNNAAVLFDWGGRASALGLGELARTLAPNVGGVAEVTRAMLPLLRKSTSACIVNMTSSGGSFAQTEQNSDGFAPAYQVSKAALDMYTLLLAQELAGTKIRVNCCSPGWVRTDMGTSAAPLSVEQGADTPVWLALQGGDGPNGGFFADRKRMAW
jgi:NAD(P)-dependent dehydrogenase (short-subunit alcohol dehydrogenase family)